MEFDTRPAVGATQITPATPRRYPTEFTASGSEYFRIWIVNLLLIVLTLGIYLPWAKVRKLKYFYRNTGLGGDALDFHGEPKKMLRGTATRRPGRWSSAPRATRTWGPTRWRCQVAPSC